MRTIKLFLTFIVLLALLACTKDDETQVVKPFIGGTDGVIVDFSPDLRKEVYDGGGDSFNVGVKLHNKGETLVSKDNVVVKLSGFKPSDLGKQDEEMTKKTSEDVESYRKGQKDEVIPSQPVFVEFTDLKYLSQITGSSLPFPLRADVCYKYATKAISKLCYRQSIMNPATGGICEINEDKAITNSGSPLQIQNFKEFSKGSDKISFTFDIKHVGNGLVFSTESGRCELSKEKNKVYVSIDTGIDGLSCPPLTTKSGTSVEGTVQLFEGSKQIQCTQTVTDKRDYEKIVNLKVDFDYSDSKTTEITVKHSAE